MDTDQSKMAREYMECKVEMNKLTARIEVLKPLVLEAMMDYNGTEAKVQSSLGKLSIRATQSWTFPIEIVKADEEVKSMKKVAKQDGTATSHEVPSLLFKEITEDNIKDEPISV